MGERMAERVALVSKTDPRGILGSATYSGDVIDASLYDSLMFVMSIGKMTSSGKVTMTVYKGTGSSAATITTSITSAELTCTGAAGTFETDQQVIVDVDVSKEGAYRYYKGTVVAGGTTTGGSYLDVAVFGSRARYHPGSDDDLASVKSITYA